MAKIVRPEIVQDEHLVFLDALRKSGATNMYGAGSWLRDEFETLSKKDSHLILSYWMQTFGKEDR